MNTLRVKVTTIEQSLSMQRLLSKATLESFTVKCVYTLVRRRAHGLTLFVFSLFEIALCIPLLLETRYIITNQ